MIYLLHLLHQYIWFTQNPNGAWHVIRKVGYKKYHGHRNHYSKQSDWVNYLRGRIKCDIRFDTLFWSINTYRPFTIWGTETKMGAGLGIQSGHNLQTRLEKGKVLKICPLEWIKDWVYWPFDGKICYSFWANIRLISVVFMFSSLSLSYYRLI